MDDGGVLWVLIGGFVVCGVIFQMVMNAGANAARKAVFGLNATELNNQAVERLDRGNTELAEKELLQSIDKNDNQPIVYLNLAAAMISNNKHSEAIEKLRSALKRFDPSGSAFHVKFTTEEMHKCYYLIGLAYEYSGAIDEALDAFYKCIHDANYINSMMHIGIIRLFNKKEFGAAVEIFEEIIAKDCNYVGANLALGLAYVGIKNKILATEQYKKLYALDKESAQTLYDALNELDIMNSAGESKLDKYYSVLEINISATTEDIKAAYRELVKVWHPDRFQHDIKLQLKAQEKLKQINEAYSIIMSNN